MGFFSSLFKKKESKKDSLHNIFVGELNNKDMPNRKTLNTFGIETLVVCEL